MLSKHRYFQPLKFVASLAFVVSCFQNTDTFNTAVATTMARIVVSCFQNTDTFNYQTVCELGDAVVSCFQNTDTFN